jgi:hypothetical protein
MHEQLDMVGLAKACAGPREGIHEKTQVEVLNLCVDPLD